MLRMLRRHPRFSPVAAETLQERGGFAPRRGGFAPTARRCRHTRASSAQQGRRIEAASTLHKRGR
jgi:hypothetical protein